MNPTHRIIVHRKHEEALAESAAFVARYKADNDALAKKLGVPPEPKAAKLLREARAHAASAAKLADSKARFKALHIAVSHLIEAVEECRA